LNRASRGKASMHLLVMLAIIVPLVACGKSENVSKPGTGSDNKEPIELVFASHLGMYPEDFERDIGNPIRQKFPHITPKYIERGNGTNLPDLVAAGTPPDITWFVHGNFVGSIQALGLDYDMTDLVKKIQL